MTVTELLRVEHLTMKFGGLIAIDDLSFSATQGEITAIIGPNGAGKTTIFNCLINRWPDTGIFLTLPLSSISLALKGWP